jgi:Zn-finger nucleic acid-binding protein
MTTARTCPACGEDLEAYDHEGVELDRCLAGHGVWLDRGELQKVVRSERAPRTGEEQREAVEAADRDASGRNVVEEIAGPRRACPVCRAEMDLTEYAGSGVAIDECRIHGIWLDAGELERIEAYAEAMRRGQTPRGEVKGIPIPAEVLVGISGAAAPSPPPPPPRPTGE